MSRLINRIGKQEEGLTLVELIVVVAIIGVLAWMITPRVFDSLQESKLKSAESAANEFFSALERKAATTGTYLEAPTVTSGTTMFAELTEELGLRLSKANNFMHPTSLTYVTTTNRTDFCLAFRATDTTTGTIFYISKAGVVTGTAPTITDLTCTAPAALSAN